MSRVRKQEAQRAARAFLGHDVELVDRTALLVPSTEIDASASIPAAMVFVLYATGSFTVCDFCHAIYGRRLSGGGLDGAARAAMRVNAIRLLAEVRRAVAARGLGELRSDRETGTWIMEAAA